MGTLPVMYDRIISIMQDPRRPPARMDMYRCTARCTVLVIAGSCDRVAWDGHYIILSIMLSDIHKIHIYYKSYNDSSCLLHVDTENMLAKLCREWTFEFS